MHLPYAAAFLFESVRCLLRLKSWEQVGGSHLGRALGCCRGEFLDRTSGGTRHDGVLGYEKLDIYFQALGSKSLVGWRRTMPDRGGCAR